MKWGGERKRESGGKEGEGEGEREQGVERGKFKKE